MTAGHALIKENLRLVLAEISLLPRSARDLPAGELDFPGQIERLNEWIEGAGEYGIAYELISALIDRHSFTLSGNAAIKLREAASLMGFGDKLKT